MSRFHWKKRRLSAPSAFIGYNHPKNVQWRKDFKKLRKLKGIDLRLCLFYDQVWRLKYRGSATTLAKDSAGDVLIPQPELVSHHLDSYMLGPES